MGGAGGHGGGGYRQQRWRVRQLDCHARVQALDAAETWPARAFWTMTLCGPDVSRQREPRPPQSRGMSFRVTMGAIEFCGRGSRRSRGLEEKEPGRGGVDWQVRDTWAGGGTFVREATGCMRGLGPAVGLGAKKLAGGEGYSELVPARGPHAPFPAQAGTKGHLCGKGPVSHPAPAPRSPGCDLESV